MSEEEKQEQYKRHQVIYDELKVSGNILFETVIGSQAHGTSTPKSDVDTSFVYMAPKSWLYVRGDYHAHLRLSKDRVGYELEHLLDMLASANPTCMELLYAPEDCWILCHDIYRRLLNNKHRFLSKVAKSSFLGYATAQIRKAKGMEKFQNWSAERTMRKEPMDFCWVIDGEEGYSTIPLRQFMEREGLTESELGVTNIDHAPNVFSLFRGSEFRGIFGSNSDQILFSSVPKGITSIALMVYNQDAYKMHAADWKRFKDWEKNTNRDRWVKTKAGDFIDAKNVMHLVRLTQMNREIASGQGLIVRRPNRDELLAIRNGEHDLTHIIKWSEKEEREIIEMYKNSDLPDSVDMKWVRDILFEMRYEFYMQTLSMHIHNTKVFDNKFMQNGTAR
jgi:hypothetical protein